MAIALGVAGALGACAAQASRGSSDSTLPERQTPVSAAATVTALSPPLASAPHSGMPEASLVRRSIPPQVVPADVAVWLPNFYRALHELSLSRRADHVRITWFGDSHTAADFWTGEIRRRLQQRFGNGGPGFVHVGLDTRHDQVITERSGKWRTAPRSPASYERQDDGIYGLAGMRAEATAYSAQAEVRLMPTVLASLRREQSIHWELVWRSKSEGAAFTLTAGNQKPRKVVSSGKVGRSEPKQGIRVRASQLMGLQFVAKPGERIRVHQMVNNPELFGLIGELSEPGVVLDALGINGARLRTMLGWHEGVWLGELLERQPQLIVLAYGTNEVGGGMAIERYRDFYTELRARIGESLPGTDCLIVGPTDRTDEHWTTLPRVLQLDELQRQVATEIGCAYHSPLQVMLSSGGQRAWTQASPQLAAKDRVHLTRDGYHVLGDALAGQLLGSYAKIYGDSAVESRR